MNQKQYRQFFSNGDIIFRRGDKPDYAYIIESGEVEISIEKDGNTVVLAVRQAGEIFGEMALIDNNPRTATAKALNGVELTVVTKDHIVSHLKNSDHVTNMIVSVILERFRQTLTAIDPQVDTGDPSIVMPVLPDSSDKIKHQYSDAIDLIKLEKSMSDAVKNQEFILHFQPIVDLRTNTLAGFESLIRWYKGEGSLVYPGVFIEIAEKSGLIVQMGELILLKAMQTVGKMQKALAEVCGPNNRLFISVNVSGYQLVYDNFLEKVDLFTKATDLSPEDLTMEITETVLIENPQKALTVLEGLKERGFSIALDDFGTGYSSLSYLHTYPIDKLKIDKSFIDEIETNESSKKIVRSIVNLADGLDISVICEGVENIGQSEIIKQIGCSHAQGFLFSPGMSETDAIEFTKKWVVEKHTCS